MKKVIVCVLVFVMLFALCACGGGVEKELPGMWDCKWTTTVTSQNYTLTADLRVSYEFMDDGKVLRSSYIDDKLENLYIGTYEIKESAIALTFDDDDYYETLDYTYENGELSLVYAEKPVKRRK